MINDVNETEKRKLTNISLQSSDMYLKKIIWSFLDVNKIIKLSHHLINNIYAINSLQFLSLFNAVLQFQILKG